MSNYVRGEGNANAKLFVLGEAPGESEDIAQRPFVGPSGELVTEMVELAGVNRRDCWVSNVCKYRPPDNDIKRLSEIGIDLKTEIENLWTEIKSINPNCILALGNTALEATTHFKGIINYRGSILESINYFPKVVPTLHPANLLHQKGGEISNY